MSNEHWHRTVGILPHYLALDSIGHGCFALDVNGSVQALAPGVRDRLIARGVLYCTDDGNGCILWRLRWHGVEPEKERTIDMSCCHFCGQRPVCWLVPCASFPMPEIPGLPVTHSVGAWTACDTCGAMIEQDRKADLLHRAQQLSTNAHLGRRELLVYKERLHQRFWRNYRGSVVRLASRRCGC